MKRTGLVDDDGRALALEALGRPAVARQRRVQLEEIVVRQPLVEAHRPRIEGRARLHRADVPLAEVAGGVAGLAQQVGDGDLLRAHRPVGGEGAVAHRMTPRQHAPAGGRARRVPRVEPVQPQARGGHGVEDRGLQVGVPVVAGLLPAVVVAHQEDDVRAVGGPRRREHRGQRCEARQRESESSPGKSLLVHGVNPSSVGRLPRHGRPDRAARPPRLAQDRRRGRVVPAHPHPATNRIGRQPPPGRVGVDGTTAHGTPDPPPPRPEPPADAGRGWSAQAAGVGCESAAPRVRRPHVTLPGDAPSAYR